MNIREGETRRNSAGRFYRGDEESNYTGRRRRDVPRRPSRRRHGYQDGDEEETSPSGFAIDTPSSPNYFQHRGARPDFTRENRRTGELTSDANLVFLTLCTLDERRRGTRDRQKGISLRRDLSRFIIRERKGFATDPGRIVRHNLLSANRSGRRCKTCANTRPRDLKPAPAQRWILFSLGVVFPIENGTAIIRPGICSGWLEERDYELN